MKLADVLLIVTIILLVWYFCYKRLYGTMNKQYYQCETMGSNGNPTPDRGNPPDTTPVDPGNPNDPTDPNEKPENCPKCPDCPNPDLCIKCTQGSYYRPHTYLDPNLFDVMGNRKFNPDKEYFAHNPNRKKNCAKDITNHQLANIAYGM